MTHLYLNRNRLSKLNVGAFEGLSNLEQLCLDNNQLETLNVGVFEGLSNLTNLFLENNQLKTLHAGTFDSLKNLYKIDLFENNLTLLEDGIFLKNENLIEINLNQNQIFAIGPKEFHWEKLGRLNLKENLCADIEPQFSKYEDKISYLSRHTKCLQSYPHFIEIYKAGIALSEKLTQCSNETNSCENNSRKKSLLLELCNADKESISRERDDLKLKDSDCKQGHGEEADKLQELFECKVKQFNLTQKLEKINQKEVSNCTSATDKGYILTKIISPPFIIFISIIILETVIIIIITICLVKKCRAKPTFYDEATVYYSSQMGPPMPRSRDSNLYATPYDIDQLNVGPNGIPLYAQVNKPKALKTQLDL
jgi:hypothetical protein